VRLLALAASILFSLSAIAADRQIIGTGTTPGDRTGDSPYIAWQKANANFLELFSRSSALSNSWAGSSPTNITPLLGALYQDGTNNMAWTATAINIQAPPFLAAGDGLTDDTAAWTNALVAARALNLPVYAPAGTYLISSTLQAEGTTIYGDSPSTTVLKWEGDDAGPIIAFDAGGSYHSKPFGLSSLELHGNSVANGVRNDGINWGKISRVWVYGTPDYGIALTNAAYYNTIKECIIGTSAGHGIWYAVNGSGNTIQNNTIQDCLGAAIYYGTSTAGDSISGNKVENCAKGIDLPSGMYSTEIANNYFEVAAGYMQALDIGSRGTSSTGPLDIHGNWFYIGCGVYVTNFYRCSFDNNSVLNTGDSTNILFGSTFGDLHMRNNRYTDPALVTINTRRVTKADAASTLQIGVDGGFGMLGIGKAPAFPIDVFSSNSTLATFTRDMDTDSGMSFKANSSGPILDTVGPALWRIYVNAEEKLSIGPQSSIFGNGTNRVGINVAVPSAPLDVYGTNVSDLAIFQRDLAGTQYGMKLGAEANWANFNTTATTPGFKWYIDSSGPYMSMTAAYLHAAVPLFGINIAPSAPLDVYGTNVSDLAIFRRDIGGVEYGMKIGAEANWANFNTLDTTPGFKWYINSAGPYAELTPSQLYLPVALVVANSSTFSNNVSVLGTLTAEDSVLVKTDGAMITLRNASAASANYILLQSEDALTTRASFGFTNAGETNKLYFINNFTGGTYFSDYGGFHFNTNVYSAGIVNGTNGFAVGAQPGIAATVDVLVSGGTTNRLVYVGGILVSNITNFAE